MNTLYPMINPQIVSYSDGNVLSADGRSLFIGSPRRPGIYSPSARVTVDTYLYTKRST